MALTDYAVVTGASRGLGAALCTLLLAKGYTVIATARRPYPPEALAGKIDQLFWSAFDLSDVSNVLRFAVAVRRTIDYSRASSILLVNNAGTIAPVAPVLKLDCMQVVPHITLNTAVPIILTSQLLADIDENTSNRVPANIINITSGAAEKPYFGRAVYCASKAGLNMFTKTLSSEFDARHCSHRVWAVRPGAIDTDMQRYSRELPNEATGARARFLQLKENGELLGPGKAAELVLRTIDDSRVTSGSIIDVRSLYPDEV